MRIYYKEVIQNQTKINSYFYCLRYALSSTFFKFYFCRDNEGNFTDTNVMVKSVIFSILKSKKKHAFTLFILKHFINL